MSVSDLTALRRDLFVVRIILVVLSMLHLIGAWYLNKTVDVQMKLLERIESLEERVGPHKET